MRLQLHLKSQKFLQSIVQCVQKHPKGLKRIWNHRYAPVNSFYFDYWPKLFKIFKQQIIIEKLILVKLDLVCMLIKK